MSSVVWEINRYLTGAGCWRPKAHFGQRLPRKLKKRFKEKYLATKVWLTFDLAGSGTDQTQSVIWTSQGPEVVSTNAD